MRVLITGHNGYIGSVMAPLVAEAGHDVTGLDTYFFEDCTFGDPVPDVPALRKDIRDVGIEDVAGFEAVIHLAALSNDPLGDLSPDSTSAINHRATVGLAQTARAAGVGRFLFASSCSLYGVAGDDVLDETARFNPITAYGASKVHAERDVASLATDDFSPTFLRNATAYGVSPRLRADVVVNNLVGYAFTTGEVLLQSDGTTWRPLVHVEDFCRAFLAVLHAPREKVHNEAFNVGRTEENYQIKDLAELVSVGVPGSRIEFASGAGPDPRSYRVSCDKLQATLPDYRPTWTVAKGVAELRAAFETHELERAEFLGDRYFRTKQIAHLQQLGRLDASLRWSDAVEVVERVAP